MQRALGWVRHSWFPLTSPVDRTSYVAYFFPATQAITWCFALPNMCTAARIRTGDQRCTAVVVTSTPLKLSLALFVFEACDEKDEDQRRKGSYYFDANLVRAHCMPWLLDPFSFLQGCSRSRRDAVCSVVGAFVLLVGACVADDAVSAGS
jgi:hypothetical protein